MSADVEIVTDAGEVVTTRDYPDGNRERSWVLVRMPRALCYCPAADAEEAYAQLSRACYHGAPVREWPIVGTITATRSAIRRGDFAHLFERGAA